MGGAAVGLNQWVKPVRGGGGSNLWDEPIGGLD